jgi:hypothetical protein
LLFFNQDLSEETASRMFAVIMNYEQNEVYSPNEVTQVLE